MQAIFNAPIGTDLLEQLFRRDLISGQARNALHDLCLNPACFDGDKAMLQLKYLL